MDILHFSKSVLQYVCSVSCYLTILNYALKEKQRFFWVQFLETVINFCVPCCEYLKPVSKRVLQYVCSVSRCLAISATILVSKASARPHRLVLVLRIKYNFSSSQLLHTRPYTCTRAIYGQPASLRSFSGRYGSLDD